ncbi:MAG TPA: hypothetical protein VKS24_22020 [Bradyrhizobium sp.]|nr:hypothetical protein [Bradyrhizobium sp.]
MTKLVLRIVTLCIFLTVLIAAPSFTPAFAMGGGAGGTGSGAYPSSLTRLDPPDQPSPQPRRAHVKSTHKIKKTTMHSSIRQPGT